MNNEELKSNLLSSKHWLRLLFMVLFALLFQVATLVMWVLVVLQFLFSLITGRDNRNLRAFGASLSTYIHQTLKFLTYVSDEKPFPFSDWPSEDEDIIDAEVAVVATPVVTPAETPAETQVVNPAPGSTDSNKPSTGGPDIDLGTLPDKRW